MGKLILSVAAAALLQLTLVSAILPADYQTRSAAQKQNLLWNQLTWDRYTSFPTGTPPALQMAKVLIPTYHTTAFNRVSDEMSEGRIKILHPYGSCAKADFIVHANSPYTGVFTAGVRAKTIIRPSVAAWHEIGAGLAPGLGVKVLVDGKPSQNFHTLFTTEGQGPNNNNFFLKPVSNQFPMIEPSGFLAVAVQAMRWGLALLAGGAEARPADINLLGLYEQSSLRPDGTVVPVGTVVAPWKIDFVPNVELHTPADNRDDFRTQLEAVPAGTKLYDIRAYPTQASFAAGTPGVVIGEVVSTSAFVTSVYCDEGLLLQHASVPWHAQ